MLLLVVTMVLFGGKVVVDAWKVEMVITYNPSLGINASQKDATWALSNSKSWRYVTIPRSAQLEWLICFLYTETCCRFMYQPALMQARARPVPVPLRKMVLKGTPCPGLPPGISAKAAAVLGFLRSYRHTSFLSQGSWKVGSLKGGYCWWGTLSPMLFSILWVYSSSGVCDLDRNYFPNSLIIIMRIMVKIYVTAKEPYLNRDSGEKKCEFFSVSVLAAYPTV